MDMSETIQPRSDQMNFDDVAAVPATVTITWGDQRWNDADGDGTVDAAEGNQTFTTVTRL